MQTGKYDRSFTWLQRTLTQDTNTGQDKQSFASNGTLWGNLTELSANKKLAFGMLNSQADMMLKLRQFPLLNTEDRLRDKRFNLLFIIDGINHNFGANETIVYCHKISEVE